MKTKRIALLIYIGVCSVLVTATVLIGLQENRQVTGSAAPERYSYSIGVTPTPMPTVDLSEVPDAPLRPAQYDEGAPPPTPSGEDEVDT